MWPEIIPTVIICALLVGAVVLAVLSIIKDKKKGKGCGCGCSSCSLNGSCHAANAENKSSPDIKSEDNKKISK